jgi:hypothetical protein
MKNGFFSVTRLVLFFAFCACSASAQSQEENKKGESAEELAKKLSNPVASLISVPFQNNTDYGIGAHNGVKNTLNFQPVVPIKLSPKLNLITRYIIPIITQYDVTGDGTKQNGLGDATISAFFSPVGSKIIWAVGPAFLVPIATNNLLGTKKLGVGPTALALKQMNGWTVGALVNQIWSVAGDKSREDVSQLFVQPFLTHNWKSGAGLGVNFEMSQNWKASTDALTAYCNPTISGVTKLGKQTVSLAAGPRIPVAAPDALKPDWGWRAVVTFVFPK